MSCPPQFWDGVLRRLGAELPAFSLDTWVRPLSVRLDGERLLLGCPTPFHRDRVRDRLLERIARCVVEESGAAYRIDLAVCGKAARAAAAATSAPASRDASPLVERPAPRGAPPAVERAAPGGALPLQTQPTRAAEPRQHELPYTFDTFVVGPGNALAREASFALAHDRQPGLNPLYLTSTPGLGKTHLARAVVAAARRESGRQILYESAESFTNRFMASLRSRSMDDFKSRYRRGCELLVVEDVQFLASKRATQLELFHTLTHLVDAGVRVVLTGNRLPRQIEGLERELQDRMAAGLVAEIEPPDAAVRRRILRAKAAGGGVRLPEECLDLLVDSLRGSVRDLESALIQLVATASLLKRSIDLELTSSALRKLGATAPRPRRLPPEEVIETVAGFFGVTRAALASRSRRRDVLLPRQLAMYLCRRYTDEPLSAIARRFDRDHPAASNAVRTVERRILERAPLRYQVEELSARLDRLAREG